MGRERWLGWSNAARGTQDAACFVFRSTRASKTQQVELELELSRARQILDLSPSRSRCTQTAGHANIMLHCMKHSCINLDNKYPTYEYPYLSNFQLHGNRVLISHIAHQQQRAGRQMADGVRAIEKSEKPVRCGGSGSRVGIDF